MGAPLRNPGRWASSSTRRARARAGPSGRGSEVGVAVGWAWVLGGGPSCRLQPAAQEQAGEELRPGAWSHVAMLPWTALTLALGLWLTLARSGAERGECLVAPGPTAHGRRPLSWGPLGGWVRRPRDPGGCTQVHS